jgi:hypothetical protein
MSCTETASRHPIDIETTAAAVDCHPDVLRCLLENADTDVTIVDVLALNQALALVITETERKHNDIGGTNRALMNLQGHLIPWTEHELGFVEDLEATAANR